MGSLFVTPAPAKCNSSSNKSSHLTRPGRESSLEPKALKGWEQWCHFGQLPQPILAMPSLPRLVCV